jgi:hypothetical protein
MRRQPERVILRAADWPAAASLSDAAAKIGGSGGDSGIITARFMRGGGRSRGAEITA